MSGREIRLAHADTLASPLFADFMAAEGAFTPRDLERLIPIGADYAAVREDEALFETHRRCRACDELPATLRKRAESERAAAGHADPASLANAAHLEWMASHKERISELAAELQYRQFVARGLTPFTSSHGPRLTGAELALEFLPWFERALRERAAQRHTYGMEGRLLGSFNDFVCSALLYRRVTVASDMDEERDDDEGEDGADELMDEVVTLADRVCGLLGRRDARFLWRVLGELEIKLETVDEYTDDDSGSESTESEGEEA